MSSVGVSEKPTHLRAENLVQDRKEALSRYGAQWLLDTWAPTNSFSPLDFYRAIGYYPAIRVAKNGLARRIRDGVMTKE